ncbi:MAG: sigma-70 family RNA polymerase sigma factor [Aureispira sp.]|nr:sigma-70 family RNA polymerase sigma factor [Aureispira sp.]
MEDLLKQLKLGNQQAYEKLYYLAFKSCANLVLKNNGSRNDAEDIFQEALYIFLLKIREPNFELSCKISTYLYAITSKLWLKQLHKKSKQPYTLVVDEIQEKLPDVSIEQEEEDLNQELLILAMQTLDSFGKEECKQLLKLYYFDRFSLQSIADILGYSPKYTKKKKANCLKYLKKAIELKSKSDKPL